MGALAVAPCEADDLITGDAHEPRREGDFAPLVARQAAEHLQEDFFGHILGIVLVTEAREGVAVHLVDVRVVQRSECFQIAGLGSLNRPAFRLPLAGAIIAGGEEPVHGISWSREPSQ